MNSGESGDVIQKNEETSEIQPGNNKMKFCLEGKKGLSFSAAFDPEDCKVLLSNLHDTAGVDSTVLVAPTIPLCSFQQRPLPVKCHLLYIFPFTSISVTER